MTHQHPEEFAEDLIALDEYRNPRFRPLFPDPRITKAMQQQAHAQFMATLCIAVAAFVLLLWLLPAR